MVYLSMSAQAGYGKVRHGKVRSGSAGQGRASQGVLRFVRREPKGSFFLTKQSWYGTIDPQP